MLCIHFGAITGRRLAGAAWGTNIGVTVELIVLAAVAMRPAMRRQFNSLDWRLRPDARLESPDSNLGHCTCA